MIGWVGKLSLISDVNSCHESRFDYFPFDFLDFYYLKWIQKRICDNTTTCLSVRLMRMLNSCYFKVDFIEFEREDEKKIAISNSVITFRNFKRHERVHQLSQITCILSQNFCDRSQPPHNITISWISYGLDLIAQIQYPLQTIGFKINNLNWTETGREKRNQSNRFASYQMQTQQFDIFFLSSSSSRNKRLHIVVLPDLWVVLWLYYFSVNKPNYMKMNA